MNRYRIGGAVAIVLSGVIAVAALGIAARGPAPTARTPGGTASPVQPTEQLGISEQEAIRIAVAAVHPDEALAKTARATMEKGTRWVWRVEFFISAGPTSGSGYGVVIDYWTGEVLETATIVS